MISVPNTILNQKIEDDYFFKHLQSLLSFTLGKKVLRKGRLIIFKKTHYFFQITILNSKNQIECFEIPLPFKTEYHSEENLLYFDYRIKTLSMGDKNLEKKLLCQIGKITPSQYFNKILEIQTFLPPTIP